MNKRKDFSRSRADMSEKWEEICNDTSLPKRNLNHILDRLHHGFNISSVNQNKSVGRQFYVWFSKLAAILIIPFLLAGMYFHHEWRDLSSESEKTLVEIYSPHGARTKFVLPDGTKGVLNGDSKIGYAMNFNKNRSVNLSGEVYFDVVHDKERSFLVNTPDIKVKVLGTQFSVAAYEGEDVCEVVLESGKVELENRVDDRKIVMKPNQQIRYEKKTGSITRCEVNARELTAWRSGRLVFRNEGFEDVAKRLSRWFDVEVVIGDEVLKNYRYRATFEDERLERVLMLLKLTAPIDYKIERIEQLSDSTFSKQKVVLFLRN